MPLTDEQREKICAAARSYLGTPWRGQGRDHLGIDCTGIVECAYIDAGMPVEPLPATYRGVDSKLLVQNLKRYCKRILDIRQARPADIVLYAILANREAHLAILVPPRKPGHPMNGIHCPAGGKAVEVRFDFTMGNIRGIYTWQ